MSSVDIAFQPATVAAFKRAMTPGTRIRVDNIPRPQANGERVVLDKTNTVDLVMSHPDAPHGSHLSWPKKGEIVHDGDRIWGLQHSGEVWLSIEVLS